MGGGAYLGVPKIKYSLLVAYKTAPVSVCSSGNYSTYDLMGTAVEIPVPNASLYETEVHARSVCSDGIWIGGGRFVPGSSILHIDVVES